MPPENSETLSLRITPEMAALLAEVTALVLEVEKESGAAVVPPVSDVHRYVLEAGLQKVLEGYLKHATQVEYFSDGRVQEALPKSKTQGRRAQKALITHLKNEGLIRGGDPKPTIGAQPEPRRNESRFLKESRGVYDLDALMRQALDADES